MRKLYSYLTLYRPPMPGGIPRGGLVAQQGFDQLEERFGELCWGVVVYDRALTEKEISDYELAPLEIGYEREEIEAWQSL